MSRWLFFLRQLSDQLRVRTALFCLVALVTVAVAILAGPYVPSAFADRFGGDTVEHMLNILSSSMLVITTFSLGTMVNAHNSAASNATPRAAPLLVQDDYAQNALSIFIGVFVFSMISLIALDAGVYESGSRAVLFVTTVCVVVLVVVALIQWVDELSELGQMQDTLELIEKSTLNAIDSHRSSPISHARHFSKLPDGIDVYADQIGYVQTMDFALMNETLSDSGASLYLLSQSGSFSHRNRPLCRMVGLPQDYDIEKILDTIRSAFLIGPRRTPLQDPRYGMIVLSEVAARALSPGVNDPGTAIDVLVVETRVLDHWHNSLSPKNEKLDSAYPWLYANPIDMGDLISNGFAPLIRYGSEHAPVIIRLFKALEAVMQLDRHSYEVAVKRLAAQAMDRASALISDEHDLALVRSTYEERFNDV